MRRLLTTLLVLLTPMAWGQISVTPSNSYGIFYVGDTVTVTPSYTVQVGPVDLPFYPITGEHSNGWRVFQAGKYRIVIATNGWPGASMGVAEARLQ